MAVLQTGSVESQSENAPARGDATSTVDVPARLSMEGVKLHQDRFGNGATVDGLVAAVYLTGDGNMTFVHADSQEEHSRFEIAPGLLIMWNNSRLMHKIDISDNNNFRVMLGPMSLDPASGSGVVQVGAFNPLPTFEDMLGLSGNSTMLELMQHPDTVFLNALDREDPGAKFTMFVPENNAFDTLPDDLKTKLTVKPIQANHLALFQDMLKFHVFSDPTITPYDAAWPEDSEVATMSPGNNLTLKLIQDINRRDTYHRVQVSSADNEEQTAHSGGGHQVVNGVVYYLEKVLLPPSCKRTVAGIATGSKDHTELVKLLTAVELVAVLTNTTVGIGYTVFAPTNAAFAKIDTATMNCLVLPENKANLENLLKYHVVAQTIVASNLTNGREITSLDEKADQYTYASAGTLTPLEGTASKITTMDLLATNGVVHVIDTVLIPKGFVAKLVCPTVDTTPVATTPVPFVDIKSAASPSSSSFLAIVVFTATVVIAMFF